MFGFSKAFAGIDISARAIRAVRIKNGALEGYAQIPLPEGLLQSSYIKENIRDVKGFQEVAGRLLGAVGVQKGDIGLSIPDQVVKVSFMELKDVPSKKKEIVKFIKWKSKKFLPYDAENAKIDYQLFGDSVMAVIIKDEVINNYEDAFALMGFRASFISTPSLNLFNLFFPMFGDNRNFAFISILENSLSVIIVRDGVMDFHRSTECGFMDERLMQEINSSIMFYMSENRDASIGRAFLYAGKQDCHHLPAQLTDIAGMEVVPLRISTMLKGPSGLDIEEYGPAVAAALGGR